MGHFLLSLIFISLPAFCLDLKQSQALFARKQFEQIISQLGPQVEKLDPDLLKLLGKSYQEKGDHEHAVRVFESVIATNAKDYETKTLLGREYAATKKEREALTQFKEAIEINPKYEQAYLDAAAIYLKRKNKYELRLIYQDLLDRIGEKAEYLKNLCALSTQDGLLENAIQYCKRGQELKADESQNYLNLALAYKATGQKDLSLREFSRAAESFPNSSEAQTSLADYYNEEKNYPKALLHYQKGAQLDKKNLKATQGEAFSAYQLEKYAQSYEAFKRACDLEQNTSKTIRKIIADLRLKPKNEWLRKFELLIESCKGDQGISVSKNF